MTKRTVTSRSTGTGRRRAASLKALNEAVERRVPERTRELSRTEDKREGETTKRRGVEETLPSGELLRWFIELAADAIAIVGDDGRIAMVNRDTEKMFRYSRDALLGKPVELLMPVRFRQTHLSHRAAYQRNPHRRRMGTGLELVGRRKDGSEFPIDVSLGGLKTKEGTVVVASIRNITERKRAEETLRESEQRYRLLVESMNEGLGVLDEQGLITYVNDRMCEMLEYEPGELTGSRVTEIIHEDSRSAFTESMAERAKGGGGSYELELVTKHGRSVAVIVSPKPLFDGAGKMHGSFAVFTDITERKRAEETLRESEQRYRLLVEKMNDGLGVLDEQGLITCVNDRLCEMLGYSRDELIGLRAAELLDEGSQNRSGEQRAGRRQGSGISYDVELRTKDRGTIFAIASTQALLTPEGRPQGSFAVLTDVTEHKRAEEALREAHIETVLLLAAATEGHDHTTGIHLRSVRALAEALASQLDYGEDNAWSLGLAAVLHDVGKLHVRDSVLASTGRLSDQEWELMRRHTIWGSELLAGRPGFELAATIARSHHERWDGTGYPDGLAGAAIPEAASIVAVADAFDAMTHDRPYQARRSVDQAVREIAACSGPQFSPQIVDALEHLYRHNTLPLTPPPEREAAA